MKMNIIYWIANGVFHFGLLFLDTGTRGCFGPRPCDLNTYSCAQSYSQDVLNRYLWLVGKERMDEQHILAGMWPIGPTMSTLAVNCTARWHNKIITDNVNSTRIIMMAVGSFFMITAVGLKLYLRARPVIPNASSLIGVGVRVWHELCIVTAMQIVLLPASYAAKYIILRHKVVNGMSLANETVKKISSELTIEPFKAVIADIFSNWTGLAIFCAVLTVLSSFIQSVLLNIMHFQLPRDIFARLNTMRFTALETAHVFCIILTWNKFVNVKELSVQQMYAVAATQVISHSVFYRVLRNVEQELSPSKNVSIRCRLIVLFRLICVSALYADIGRVTKTIQFNNLSPSINGNVLNLWLQLPFNMLAGSIWGMFAQTTMELCNETVCHRVLNCPPTNLYLPAIVLKKLISLIVSSFELFNITAEFDTPNPPSTTVSLVFVGVICEAMHCVVIAGYRHCRKTSDSSPIVVVAAAAGGSNATLQAAVVVPAVAETDHGVNVDQTAASTAPHVVDGIPSNCPICLNPMTVVSTFQKTACGHTFHKECLTRWLEMQPTCFNCGRPVNSIATA